MGVIYVVHTNMFFWLLYIVLIRPFLGLFRVSSKVVVVETVEELLQYFDAEQLFLLSFNESSTSDELRLQALSEISVEQRDAVATMQAPMSEANSSTINIISPAQIRDSAAIIDEPH